MTKSIRFQPSTQASAAPAAGAPSRVNEATIIASLRRGARLRSDPACLGLWPGGEIQGSLALEIPFHEGLAQSGRLIASSFDEKLLGCLLNARNMRQFFRKEKANGQLFLELEIKGELIPQAPPPTPDSLQEELRRPCLAP